MILLDNAHVFTMNVQRDELLSGAVLIDGRNIVAVGPRQQLRATYADRIVEIIDCTDKIVLPGFVNGHTHVFQILLRGIADGLPTHEWSGKVIFPLSGLLDEDELHLAGRACAMEMALSGTTCCVDSTYPHVVPTGIDVIAYGLTEVGLRAVLSRNSRDAGPSPASLKESPQEAAAGFRAAFERLNGAADGRVSIRAEAGSEASASGALVEAMVREARDHGCMFHMHFAETLGRWQMVRDLVGGPPTRWLEKLGALGPDVLLAHCVWLDDDDLDLLAETGTKVVHNPVANQYLADGIAPLPGMLRRGITVGLGTDGPSSNNSLSMPEVLKAAVLLQRVGTRQADIVSAYDVVELATRKGAEALGLGDSIGSVEAGKLADLLVIDTMQPGMQPCFEPLKNVVFSFAGCRFDHVFVNGTEIVRDGKLLLASADDILRKLSDFRQGFSERLSNL